MREKVIPRPRVLLLGPVRVLSAEGSDVTPTTNKSIHLLSLLAAHANHPVTVDKCISELWPTGPPTGPTSTLQTYVLNLRVHLRPAADAMLLESRNNSYVLTVPEPDMAIDLHRFRALVRDVDSTDPWQYPTAALTALALWRGIVFADIKVGSALTGVSHHLNEQRRAVLAAAYIGLLHQGGPIPEQTIKVLYKSGLDYRLDERFFAGFSICTALSFPLRSTWQVKVENWRDYLEAELEANLGVGASQTTQEITRQLAAGEPAQAARTWIEQFGSSPT